MNLGLGATVQTLARLGVDQGVFLSEGQHGFKAVFFDTPGYEIVDNPLSAAHAEVCVVVDVANAIGMAIDAEFHVRMVNNPVRLTVETVDCLCIKRVFVKAEVYMKGNLRLELAL